MKWMKLDPEYSYELALKGLSDAAYRTHTEAISYLYSEGSADLRIPKHLLRRITGSDHYVEAAEELIDAGCWRDEGTHYAVVHHADVVQQYIAAQQDQANRSRSSSNRRRARLSAAEVTGPVPASVYAAIRSSGACVYCGRHATHVDHVLPLARGGWEHESNLVPACGHCNCSKGTKLLAEWDPVRVAHGVAHSPKVAAEFARLAELTT